MHNPAAKYHARIGHNPSTELYFPSFWKEIDEVYFCQLDSQEELTTTAQNFIQSDFNKSLIGCNSIGSPTPRPSTAKKPSIPQK